MEQTEYEKRRKRRQIKAEWRESARDIKNGTDRQKKMLQREARREAIAILEDAARTQAEFEKVLVVWDEIERVESWRIDKHEENYDDELPEYEMTEFDTVIPQPLNHVYWRQMLTGNFLDVIHDCPHEIHEMTSSRMIYDFTKELDDNHKEIMYYWAIRLWSPQRIAVLRGQTDRNIRKVYNKMIADMRSAIFDRLYPRYEKDLPLTFTQQEFMRNYIEKLDENKKK